MKLILRGAALLAVLTVSSTASAAILTEITFDGNNAASFTGTNNSIPSSDGQFTVVNPGITFETPGAALAVVGNWVDSGTAAVPSLATTGLFNSGTANFGSPTRFDVRLGNAAPLNTYTITGLELVMRANNNTTAVFEAAYRDLGGTPQFIAFSDPIDPPGGDPLKTFAIDLTGEGLFATDSSTNFDTSGSGGIRFLFRRTSPLASDNFQVHAIRVLGDVTAVPEPSSLAMIAIAGAGLGLRRRRRV